MSKQPKYRHPPAFAERLFRRFMAIYGSQKMTAMWAGLVPVDAPDHIREEREAEVRETWAEALGDFHIDVIGEAVRSLAKSDVVWPPSLPQFAEFCRQAEAEMKPVLALALPPPTSPLVPPDEARKRLAEIQALAASKNVTNFHEPAPVTDLNQFRKASGS